MWYYLTDHLEGGPSEGEWMPTKYSPFLFSSGTADPPKLLRTPPDQNYLTPAVRITGLALMSISLLCSILLAFAVWYYEDQKTIKSNQPVFLYILLIGTFVMAWSILFLSFDESNVSTEEYDEPPFLDVSCTLFPWFLTLGYILIYSAMFMKLWRLNRVLQSFRSKVHVKQVLWPCIALLGVSVIILTVWTTVEPLQWERNPVDEEFPQDETYGQCASPNDIWFTVSLGVVLLVTTLLAGFMAWRTRDVDAKFSESNWIFTTIVLQVQILIVGIPVLIIVQRQSADATYLGRVLLIWTMTISTMALMFGPKLMHPLSQICRPFEQQDHP